MSRLAPADWRTLVRVFEADGFTQNCTTGSHVVLTKPGIARPVIIPKYSEVGLDIIKEQHKDRRHVTGTVSRIAQGTLTLPFPASDEERFIPAGRAEECSRVS